MFWGKSFLLYVVYVKGIQPRVSDFGRFRDFNLRQIKRLILYGKESLTGPFRRIPTKIDNFIV